MDKWTVLHSDGQTERRTHGWIEEWMDKWMVLQSDGETKGYIDGWKDGRKNRLKDGQVRWPDDGRFQRRIYVPKNPVFNVFLTKA